MTTPLDLNPAVRQYAAIHADAVRICGRLDGMLRDAVELERSAGEALEAARRLAWGRANANEGDAS